MGQRAEGLWEALQTGQLVHRILDGMVLSVGTTRAATGYHMGIHMSTPYFLSESRTSARL